MAKTSWVVLCMAVIAAVCVPGCGGGPANQQVIYVTRNIGGREGFRQHFDAWKGKFEEQNPGWVMELVDLGNMTGAEFYKSRIATGDLPEVIMTWEMSNFLADGGHLVPLPDSFYEKYGIPLPALYKGKRYTSQAGRQIQGIVINKAMWDAAGITEPPTTWDDLFAAFRKLRQKGYRPLVFGGREWSASQPLFYAFGSDLYDRTQEPGKPSWTIRRDQGAITFASDPVAHQVIETMIQLVDEFVEKGAGSDGYNEEQRHFYGGRAATWFMGCWMAGDIEPNQVTFESAYWPVPSLLGRPPVFIETSAIPSGWAATASAKGPKLEKAMAVLDAFYDADVYQVFLNGECQFGQAANVPATRPKYAWPQANRLVDSMEANLTKYGTTLGCHIALEDMVPPTFTDSMARVMQEILAGNRNVDALLRMLDNDWDSARKAR